MRHRRKTKYFSRKFNARKALLRGLIVSLVEHGRIMTTLGKAKELRRHAEKAVTLGKKGDLNARRLLLSRIPNQSTVDTILKDISPRMKSRDGGYTRIIKIGRRPGDTAEMAFIEFVDYDFKAATAAPVAAPAKKSAKKTESSEKKTAKVSTVIAKAKRLTLLSLRPRERTSERLKTLLELLIAPDFRVNAS